MENKTYLIIGNCGSGKTWIMKQLINALNLDKAEKNGLYHYVYNEHKNIVLLGKYDGSMFEGSDRLAMNIMADNTKIKEIIETKTVIAEGDRFTNGTFIKDFNPIVLRILDDGSTGREKRGSTQTERHLKSITTRVKNIQSNYEFKNSTECFEWLLKNILEPNKSHFAQPSKKFITQESLF